MNDDSLSFQDRWFVVSVAVYLLLVTLFFVFVWLRLNCRGVGLVDERCGSCGWLWCRGVWSLMGLALVIGECDDVIQSSRWLCFNDLLVGEWSWRSRLGCYWGYWEVNDLWMLNWLWIFVGQVGRLAEIVVCLALSWVLLIDLLTFIWNGVVFGGGVSILNCES